MTARKCPRCGDVSISHDLPRPPCSFDNLKEVLRCKRCGFENYNAAFKVVKA